MNLVAKLAPILLLALLVTACETQHVAASEALSLPTDASLDVECRFEPEIPRFRSRLRVTLGEPPRSPEDSDKYVRAASALAFISSHGDSARLAIAQDSRRRLALAEVALEGRKAPAIKVVPIAPAAELRRFDDDARDYETFRKKHKLDVEAMTTLPSGEILALTSSVTRYPHSLGIVFDPRTGAVRRHDLRGLYRKLNARLDVVGPAVGGAPGELNIEGVAVVDGDTPRLVIGHRGNLNANGHNTLIEFDLVAWLAALSRSREDAPDPHAWDGIEPVAIHRIRLPAVASAADPARKVYPATLNDVLVGRDGEDWVYILPVGTEAEYVDQRGDHHDGEVIFAGIAKISGLNSGVPTCRVFQAPGDPPPGEVSLYGKLEGLAAWTSAGADAYARSLYTPRSLVVGVTDVDSETTPSVLSVLEL